jgi:hypothetical protein
MIAAVKQFLRRWTGADAEIRNLRGDLAAAEQHVTILRQSCNDLARRVSRESAVRTLLDAPDRWQPDEPLTTGDVADWAALLTTPLLRKIDLAMINMAQAEAQRAIHEPAAEAVRAAGYAAGYRAAWAIAKSLSTLPGAPTGKPETTPATDGPDLAHLSP